MQAGQRVYCCGRENTNAMSRLHSFQKEVGLKCFVMYGCDMHFRADVKHEQLTHEKITVGADGWI